MQTDMKISTILLLAIVGFLIYCLMKPAQEGFADAKKVAAPANNVQGHIVGDTVQAPVASKGASAEAQADAELVNQVLAESERRAQPVADLPNSVHNFEGAESGTGASLDTAFDKPVPENTKTDVVDLNRNNVTNYNAKDYLPKEVNDEWFNTDFSQAKYKTNDDKLINTERYVIGINTVGQSLKNASYDIRGSINVPKYSVSPWNNSTNEPDYNIKPLC